MSRKQLSKITRIAGFILIPQAVGIAAVATTSASVGSWYSQINKPTFTPPNFIFGPVWTILYLLMGISFNIVWDQRKRHNIKTAVFAYTIQLFLNFTWSAVFFGFKSPFLALIDISLLWISIIFMIAAFYKIDKRASLLQIPYVLWVSFAFVLNLYIWMLN